MYLVLKPTIVLSLATFLAPFYTIHKAKIIHIFCTMCSIVFCVYSVKTTIETLQYYFDKNTNICHFSQTALVMFLTLNLLTSHVKLNFSRKKMTGEFLELEVLFKDVPSIFCNKAKTSNSITLFSVIFSIVFIYFIEFFSIGNYSSFCMTLIYMYLESACFIPGIQFANILIVIKYIFKSLNIIIKNNYDIRLSTLNGTSSEKGNRIICRNDKNRYSVQNLKKLFKTYNGLCDTAECINGSYSMIILFLITRMFFGLVHCTYYFVTVFLKHAICDVASNGSYSMWLTQHVMIVFGFVHIVNSTALEV